MKVYDILYEADEVDGAEDWTPQYQDEMEISARVFPYFEDEIAKLNKRATKLHVPSVRIDIVREFDKEIEGRGGVSVKEPYYRIKIEGETPKLAGWEFVATIEHKDSGNIIRTVPGYAEDDGVRDFFEAQPHYCAWCKKQRRRVDTFIVKHIETGEMKQVGRNCLKDFLGGVDPKAIMWYFSFRDGIQDLVQRAGATATSKGARVEAHTDPVTVVSAAAAAIRVYGYRKSTGEQGYSGSTSHMVRLGVFNDVYAGRPDAQMQEWANVTSQPTMADARTAQVAVDWFHQLPQAQKDGNNFLHTLDVLLKSDKVTSRDVGYLCALIPMHVRATTVRQAAQQKSNEHLGTVGQKLSNLTVTVIRTRVIDGAYGTTQIVAMEDPAGNALEWFNNSSSDMEEGKRYMITGTIKKHDQYNGKNKTVLTRVKAQEIQ